jgi:uncharacterized protein (DUF1800 family)
VTVSRRRFLKTSGAVGATATTLPQHQEAAAAPGYPHPAWNVAAVTLAGTTPPPLAVIALNRLGHGARPGDIEAFNALGATPDACLQAYVDQQLNPNAIDDSACDARIAAARLKTKYGAVHEVRPLDTLNKPVAELWPLRGMDYNEYQRPFREVRVATLLRAVHSKRQLKEVLVDFWHNHFNVNASSDSAISCTFSVYDRIMRTHCVGNFRAFLEEVARSTAMMHYLDNISNRITGGEGGNENFARELFELHTLGSDNYLKFYDDRRAIGTITYNGTVYARGYIDDDVYDAAECFTGWTIANGHWERPTLNTGEFLYDPDWHYNGDKTVLSPDGFPNISARQPDMKDGKDVLDLLAGHPGTARHLCTKLCRRLISDTPPPTVIDAAVSVWMANIAAPDQIKKVVRTILLSPEFKTTWGQKFKRPFEAIVAYVRATNATLPNDFVDPADPNKGDYWNIFFYRMSETGHRLFEWSTPTGHPDLASYWASTNGMLRRWNLPYIVTQSWGGNFAIDVKGQTDANVPNGSCTQIVDFWIKRLCGRSITPSAREALIAFMAQGGDANQPPKPTQRAPDWNDPSAITDRLNSMVQLLAMCPDFHYR